MGRHTARAYENLVADFETTTDPQDCRVWAWGLGNVSHEPWFQHGNRIESFIETLERLDSNVYFHNLGFDMWFILDHIMRKGYRHTECDKLRKGEFQTLIDQMGKVYTITVYWRTGFKTQFRDSLKRIPMPVSEIAETFNLPILKGELDYDAYREPGHTLTVEELTYLRNDVHIVCMALAQQHDEGMKKLTVGSDALADYKSFGGEKVFRERFPLLAVDIDADIRKAYRGGFTYASPLFQGKVTGPGNVYDVNSLYPSVMYQQRLPWGEPQVFDSLAEAKERMRTTDVFITHLTYGAVLKKDHIPCIQIKGSTHFSPTLYQKTIPRDTEMFVSSVDLELWHEQYDLDIQSAGTTYVFRTAEGLFWEYINKWGAIKENSEGGRKAISKLFLNSLYGKFATNPNCTGKIPVWDDEHNVPKLVLGKEATRDPVYTPVGVFITAHARNQTIRAAQAHYFQFAYADTDSLHLIGDPPTDLDIHPSRLGAWKHEYSFEAGFFARAKAYTEAKTVHRCQHRRHGCQHHYADYETHIAGLPRSVAHDVRFEDYRNGRVFPGKLTPVRVPGGVVLKDVGFTLARVAPNC